MPKKQRKAGEGLKIVTSNARIDELFAAIQRDEELEVIAEIIDSGKVIIDSQDYRPGDTPIIKAARKGREELVELLLNRGANPTIVNDAGENAAVLMPDFFKSQPTREPTPKAVMTEPPRREKHSDDFLELITGEYDKAGGIWLEKIKEKLAREGINLNEEKNARGKNAVSIMIESLASPNLLALLLILSPPLSDEEKAKISEVIQENKNTLAEFRDCASEKKEKARIQGEINHIDLLVQILNDKTVVLLQETSARIIAKGRLANLVNFAFTGSREDEGPVTTALFGEDDLPISFTQYSDLVGNMIQSRDIRKRFSAYRKEVAMAVSSFGHLDKEAEAELAASRRMRMGGAVVPDDDLEEEFELIEDAEAEIAAARAARKADPSPSATPHQPSSTPPTTARQSRGRRVLNKVRNLFNRK